MPMQWLLPRHAFLWQAEDFTVVVTLFNLISYVMVGYSALDKASQDESMAQVALISMTLLFVVSLSCFVVIRMFRTSKYSVDLYIVPVMLVANLSCTMYLQLLNDTVGMLSAFLVAYYFILTGFPYAWLVCFAGTGVVAGVVVRFVVCSSSSSYECSVHDWVEVGIFAAQFLLGSAFYFSIYRLGILMLKYKQHPARNIDSFPDLATLDALVFAPVVGLGGGTPLRRRPSDAVAAALALRQSISSSHDAGPPNARSSHRGFSIRGSHLNVTSATQQQFSPSLRRSPSSGGLTASRERENLAALSLEGFEVGRPSPSPSPPTPPPSVFANSSQVSLPKAGLASSTLPSAVPLSPRLPGAAMASFSPRDEFERGGFYRAERDQASVGAENASPRSSPTVPPSRQAGSGKLALVSRGLLQGYSSMQQERSSSSSPGLKHASSGKTAGSRLPSPRGAIAPFFFDHRGEGSPGDEEDASLNSKRSANVTPGSARSASSRSALIQESALHGTELSSLVRALKLEDTSPSAALSEKNNRFSMMRFSEVEESDCQNAASKERQTLRAMRLALRRHRSFYFREVRRFRREAAEASAGSGHAFSQGGRNDGFFFEDASWGSSSDGEEGSDEASCLSEVEEYSRASSNSSSRRSSSESSCCSAASFCSSSLSSSDACEEELNSASSSEYLGPPRSCASGSSLELRDFSQSHEHFAQRLKKERRQCFCPCHSRRADEASAGLAEGTESKRDFRSEGVAVSLNGMPCQTFVAGLPAELCRRAFVNSMRRLTCEGGPLPATADESLTRGATQAVCAEALHEKASSHFAASVNGLLNALPGSDDCFSRASLLWAQEQRELPSHFRKKRLRRCGLCRECGCFSFDQDKASKALKASVSRCRRRRRPRASSWGVCELEPVRLYETSEDDSDCFSRLSSMERRRAQASHAEGALRQGFSRLVRRRRGDASSTSRHACGRPVSAGDGCTKLSFFSSWTARASWLFSPKAPSTQGLPLRPCALEASQAPVSSVSLPSSEALSCEAFSRRWLLREDARHGADKSSDAADVEAALSLGHLGQAALIRSRTFNLRRASGGGMQQQRRHPSICPVNLHGDPVSSLMESNTSTHDMPPLVPVVDPLESRATDHFTRGASRPSPSSGPGPAPQHYAVFGGASSLPLSLGRLAVSASCGPPASSPVAGGEAGPQEAPANDAGLLDREKKRQRSTRRASRGGGLHFYAVSPKVHDRMPWWLARLLSWADFALDDCRRRRRVFQRATWRSVGPMPVRDPFGLFADPKVEGWYVQWLNAFNARYFSSAAVPVLLTVAYGVVCQALIRYKGYLENPVLADKEIDESFMGRTGFLVFAVTRCALQALLSVLLLAPAIFPAIFRGRRFCKVNPDRFASGSGYRVNRLLVAASALQFAFPILDHSMRFVICPNATEVSPLFGVSITGPLQIALLQVTVFLVLRDPTFVAACLFCLVALILSFALLFTPAMRSLRTFVNLFVSFLCVAFTSQTFYTRTFEMNRRRLFCKYVLPYILYMEEIALVLYNGPCADGGANSDSGESLLSGNIGSSAALPEGFAFFTSQQAGAGLVETRQNSFFGSPRFSAASTKSLAGMGIPRQSRPRRSLASSVSASRRVEALAAKQI